MTDFIIYVFAYIWVYYKAYIVTAYVISRLIFIAYLYFNCYDKPWVASIPFGHCFAKRELTGLSLSIVIIYFISVVSFLLIFHWFWFLIMWGMSLVMNYHFSKIYVDEHNPVVYTFVPFAKVVIMVKDIIKFTHNEGEAVE